MFSKLRDRINSRKSSGYKMPIYEEFFLRPLSYPFTEILLKTSFTPNQISYFSNFLIIISIFLLHFNYNYFAFSLVFFYFILDCVDGEIARIKNLKSKKGALIEDTLPSVFLVAFFTFSYYSSIGYNYALAYILSLHFNNVLNNSINTYSIDKEEGIKINYDFLQSFLSFIKSPFFLLIAFTVNNEYILIFFCIYFYYNIYL